MPCNYHIGFEFGDGFQINVLVVADDRQRFGLLRIIGVAAHADHVFTQTDGKQVFGNSGR